MKCPNCGKDRTVDSTRTIDRRAVIDEVYANTGTNIHVVKYACKDRNFWMSTGREVTPGCGCEWVVRYAVSVIEKDTVIISEGRK